MIIIFKRPVFGLEKKAAAAAAAAVVVVIIGLVALPPCSLVVEKRKKVAVEFGSMSAPPVQSCRSTSIALSAL